MTSTVTLKITPYDSDTNKKTAATIAHTYSSSSYKLSNNNDNTFDTSYQLLYNNNYNKGTNNETTFAITMIPSNIPLHIIGHMSVLYLILMQILLYDQQHVLPYAAVTTPVMMKAYDVK